MLHCNLLNKGKQKIDHVYAEILKILKVHAGGLHALSFDENIGPHEYLVPFTSNLPHLYIIT